MKLWQKIILGVLIVIGSFLVLVGTFEPRGPETIRVDLALGSLLKYVAILITLTSGLLIVCKAVQTGSIAETLPLTIPAVIGLLILSPNWSLGIYLSVLALGHFTRTIFQSNAAPPLPTDQ
jgi:hypothetical protein